MFVRMEAVGVWREVMGVSAIRCVGLWVAGCQDVWASVDVCWYVGVLVYDYV